MLQILVYSSKCYIANYYGVQTLGVICMLALWLTWSKNSLKQGTYIMFPKLLLPDNSTQSKKEQHKNSHKHMTGTSLMKLNLNQWIFLSISHKIAIFSAFHQKNLSAYETI